MMVSKSLEEASMTLRKHIQGLLPRSKRFMPNFPVYAMQGLKGVVYQYTSTGLGVMERLALQSPVLAVSQFQDYMALKKSFTPQIQGYKKQYFKQIEDLYKERFSKFVKLANRYCVNPDLAVDIVHSAFEKSLQYKKRNPKRNFREQILDWLILKECRKVNKILNKEVAIDEYINDLGVSKENLEYYDKDRTDMPRQSKTSSTSSSKSDNLQVSILWITRYGY